MCIVVVMKNGENEITPQIADALQNNSNRMGKIHKKINGLLDRALWRNGRL